MSKNTSKRSLPLIVISLVFLVIIALALYGLFDSRGESDLTPVTETPQVNESEPVVVPEVASKALALPVQELPEEVENPVEEVVEVPVPPTMPETMPVPPKMPPFLPGSGPFPKSPDVLSQTTMSMDLPLREIGKSWLEEGGQDNFSMPLPDGRDLSIEVERFVAIGQGGGEFIGKVAGYPNSTVKLSYRGLGEAGRISIPSENRVYTYLPGGQGAVIVQEREMGEEGALVPPMLPPGSIPPMPNFIPESPPPNIEELDPAFAPPGM